MTRQTLNKARRVAESKSGKGLLRKRGEHIERSFAHVLDRGGMRRATLRGTENLTKWLTATALTYNFSLLMRKCFGFGTPKQWVAQARLFDWWLLKEALRVIQREITGIGTLLTLSARKIFYLRENIETPVAINAMWGFSTGC